MHVFNFKDSFKYFYINILWDDSWEFTEQYFN